MKNVPAKTSAKNKLLDAAFSVIRSKGYTATTVDDLCLEAGVSKGAFFHHFTNKEDLAVNAAKHWSTVTSEFFSRAPYHLPKDPLDRVLGYIDFRREMLKGDIPDYTCLVGTMVQEVYYSNPLIREACQASIFDHSATLVSDINEAKKIYSPKHDFPSDGLAIHFQAVLQGAFILAKANKNAEVAADSITHLKRYVELLFEKPKRKQ